MQTHLADFVRGTPAGDEADAILRKCVHCGFCTATCPTYQLLGDELDGPRGRIYLIKQMLEGSDVSTRTLGHLDRCLTCRSCETTCPSGVEYGHLVDIGRQVAEQRALRPLLQRAQRKFLSILLPNPHLFGPALRLGQFLRPVLPRRLRRKIPLHSSSGQWPRQTHPRRMLMLAGCVQPAMLPNINSATARVFDAIGIQLVMAPEAGCCGALRHHLSDSAGALDDVRRNIDAWWPHIQQGVESIVINASGCGAMIKEYGHLLRHDARYAARAERIAAAARDVSEILPAHAATLKQRTHRPGTQALAYHPPCTLQHGQQLRGDVERLLLELGVNLKPIQDSHLCCGSAGTYSLLQPELATRLRDNKLVQCEAQRPAMILSANVGCIAHLQSGTRTPVRHWIELVDSLLV